MDNCLILGDCLEALPAIADNSLDSLVTDPPAGISFMGKAWDSDKGGREKWVAWLASVFRECVRVLKPGAYALVWALPRTSHWTATALEEAGFEVRDVITHLFGQGFPKSMDVSKAIDKKLGAKRERLRGVRSGVVRDTYAQDAWSLEFKDSVLSPVPLTDEARQWQGWGTGLKPAAEFWILARKPLAEKSVAANVLRWGTGGVNIDGCRVGTERVKTDGRKCGGEAIYGGGKGITSEGFKGQAHEGRFPANVILEEPDLLGEAARFFYCPKASQKERGEGNHHPTVKPLALMRYLCRLVTPPGGTVLDCFMGSGSTGLAAVAEGFGFVGIEADPDYHRIAEARLREQVPE